MEKKLSRYNPIKEAYDEYIIPDVPVTASEYLLVVWDKIFANQRYAMFEGKDPYDEWNTATMKAADIAWEAYLDARQKETVLPSDI